MASKKFDEFDFAGQKVAEALLETALACDGFKSRFRYAAFTALEEFGFRLSGKFMDIEEMLDKYKEELPSALGGRDGE